MNPKIPRFYSGFTLLECLIALFVLCSLFLFIGPFIQITQETHHQLQQSKDKEWEVFLIQLEYELQEDTFVKADATTLYLKKMNGTEVLIQPYNTMIRKRENGGHQPMLMDVSTVKLKQVGKQIQMEVVFIDGHKHWGQWAIPE
ncbi:competence protein ComGF [Enterococcus sp. AZ194]|uniref:competence type IV pilus minor pilin ComGF n=1 Tax=Enterococcus sp. AZ194 TaxID=2774629 RepID=UPI003F22C398